MTMTGNNKRLETSEDLLEFVDKAPLRV